MKKTLNEKELFFYKFFFQNYFFSRNVGNSIKCKKNITPSPKPPPHLTEKSQQGNRGYLDIDSHCHYLLFGETTSHFLIFPKHFFFKC